LEWYENGQKKRQYLHNPDGDDYITIFSGLNLNL